MHVDQRQRMQDRQTWCTSYEHEGRRMSQTEDCVQFQPRMSNSKDQRGIEVPFHEGQQTQFELNALWCRKPVKSIAYQWRDVVVLLTTTEQLG